MNRKIPGSKVFLHIRNSHYDVCQDHPMINSIVFVLHIWKKKTYAVKKTKEKFKAFALGNMENIL